MNQCAWPNTLSVWQAIPSKDVKRRQEKPRQAGKKNFKREGGHKQDAAQMKRDLGRSEQTIRNLKSKVLELEYQLKRRDLCAAAASVVGQAQARHAQENQTLHEKVESQSAKLGRLEASVQETVASQSANLGRLEASVQETVASQSASLGRLETTVQQALHQSYVARATQGRQIYDLQVNVGQTSNLAQQTQKTLQEQISEGNKINQD